MKSDCGYSMQEGVTVGVLLFFYKQPRKKERRKWVDCRGNPRCPCVTPTLGFLKNCSNFIKTKHSFKPGYKNNYNITASIEKVINCAN